MVLIDLDIFLTVVHVVVYTINTLIFSNRCFALFQFVVFGANWALLVSGAFLGSMSKFAALKTLNNINIVVSIANVPANF